MCGWSGSSSRSTWIRRPWTGCWGCSWRPPGTCVCSCALRRAPERLLAVLLVVAPLRPQPGRLRQGRARLTMAPEQLQRAAPAEQREVVGRAGVRDRLELLGRLAVALRVEQRAAQRLADRRLVRVEVAGARQGHGRSVEVAALEERLAALEEVVHRVGHDRSVYARLRRPNKRGGRAH